MGLAGRVGDGNRGDDLTSRTVHPAGEWFPGRVKLPAGRGGRDPLAGPARSLQVVILAQGEGVPGICYFRFKKDGCCLMI